MDGIINILKPPGMTSFDVIAVLRRTLGIRKIGHTGTLDPAAAGVLPVCVGNATKAIEFMTEKDKLYRAELTLGISTDTQDSTGCVLDSRDVDASPERILEVMHSFTGKQKQFPPMYSAVKVQGKKLYELAREGKTIDREFREITIYSLKVLKIQENRRVLFDVSCSKGTYIRTLCADIGERLGCGGHMSFLLRMAAGKFNISEAHTLEEVEVCARVERLQDVMIPPDRAFDEYEAVFLEEKAFRKFRNGLAVEIEKIENRRPGTLMRVYHISGTFIALGEIQEKEGIQLLKSRKVFQV